MPVALSDVRNFRGTVVNAEGPDGERLDVKERIADLDRLNWAGRPLAIVFDPDVRIDENVTIAGYALAKELRTGVLAFLR
jgi:hypothetical protein